MRSESNYMLIVTYHKIDISSIVDSVEVITERPSWDSEVKTKFKITLIDGNKILADESLCTVKVCGFGADLNGGKCAE